MDVFLRTGRLVLRRFTPADLDHLVELDSDPAVMRYLSNGRPTPRDVVRDEVLPGILAWYERSPRHGQWAAIDEGGTFLGWLSLALPGLRHVRTFHLEFDDPIPGTECGEVEYAVTADEWTGG